MPAVFADHALLPRGWQRNVLIELAGDGTIASITAGTDPSAGAERLGGPVLPGMINLHSHAFQRAMAGLAETRGAADDDFWSWREAMYHLVARLDPQQIGAIAAQLYCELLAGGFTSVVEFHYLHHQRDGTRYDDPAETSLHVIEAARTSGIGITHLPVLYARGGFDDRPLGPAQRRFRGTPEEIAGMATDLAQRYAGDGNVRTGLALHSLRAVDAAQLAAATSGIRAADPTAPVHLHIAEQPREVEECLAAYGARPVEWLLEHAAVDGNWCAVHATHLTEGEVTSLAQSGAVAGLCPTTEADLGDGVFPLSSFLTAGGTVGIGTDSHVCRSAAAELRWLEYGQRLLHRRRCVAATAAQPSVGGHLWDRALAGGRAACGRLVGALAVGRRADLVVVDGNALDLTGRTADEVLDGLVFSGAAGMVNDVMVGGKWRVRGGRHLDGEQIGASFRRTLATLRETKA